MKLIIFTTKNTKSRKSGRPTIFFNRNGLISLSGSALEKMKLSEGDAVQIAQDEHSPGDWYVSKSDRGYAFKLRKYKSGRSMGFNNAYLAKKILDSVNIEGSRSFLIGDPTDNWFPILTAAAKHDK